jgi:hypothetical protein
MFRQRSWEIEQYLLEKPAPIHSFYRLERFDSPYYSWLHPAKTMTKIYATNGIHKFAMMDQGLSLPAAFEEAFTQCTNLVSDIRKGTKLPEYITMGEFYCAEGAVKEACY